MVRIIEPKVELVTEIDAQKIMQNIETAARTADAAKIFLFIFSLSC